MGERRTGMHLLNELEDETNEQIDQDYLEIARNNEIVTSSHLLPLIYELQRNYNTDLMPVHQELAENEHIELVIFKEKIKKHLIKIHEEHASKNQGISDEPLDFKKAESSVKDSPSSPEDSAKDVKLRKGGEHKREDSKKSIKDSSHRSEDSRKLKKASQRDVKDSRNHVEDLPLKGEDSLSNRKHESNHKSLKREEEVVEPIREGFMLTEVDAFKKRRESSSSQKSSPGHSKKPSFRQSKKSSSSNHSSDPSKSPRALKNLSRLPDYQEDVSLVSENVPKPHKARRGSSQNSLSNLADVSKNITIIKGPKLIRYTFEEITFAEFQKRICSKDHWLKEKLLLQSPSKQILLELMTQCRIVPRPDEVLSFPSELSSVLSHKHSSKPSHSQSDSLSYEDFLDSCLNWHKAVHTPKDLKSKLIRSIKDYENMKLKMLPTEDPTFIDSLITILKTQLRKVLETSTKSNPVLSIEEKGRSALHEIFLKYSRPTGVEPNTTIGQSRQKFETLALSGFLQFCEDFSVLQRHKNPEKNRIKQSTLERIFQLNSSAKKVMYEYHFFQGVEEIAVVFFDDQYDTANKTHWKDLKGNEKLVKLFEVLGLHEPAVYLKKMKGKALNETGLLGKSTVSSKHAVSTPKINYKGLLAEKSKGNGGSSSKIVGGKKEAGAQPVTWKQLNKLNPEDERGLIDLIGEGSDDYEALSPGKMIVTPSRRNISEKVMQRAEELERINKKQENEKLKQLLKLADEKQEKAIMLAKKFKNK